MQTEIDPKKDEIQISKSTQQETKRKIIYLSIFISLVTITFSSFSTVMVYMHQKQMHKGYGESYLTANMVTSVSVYLFCPFIVRKYPNSSKKLFIICTIGYFLNVFIPAVCSAYESFNNTLDQSRQPSKQRFVLEIIANSLGGAASGLFWVLQGIYMANFCKQFPENAKGRYFSIANAILNTRLVLAPLLTMFGLGLGNEAMYYGLLCLVILVSLPIVVLKIPSINLEETYSKPLSNADEDILDEDQERKKRSILKYFIEFIKYFKKVSLILPMSILSGFIVGFVSSSLSHLIPKPADGKNKDNQISFALIFFGLGNVLGGHLSGKFADRFSIKKASYIGAAFVVIGVIIESICLSIDHNFILSCLVAFLDGLSYSYLFSLVGIICTVHYKGNSFSFATTRLSSSIFFIIYQWFVALMNNKSNMKSNMTYQGLALIPFALVTCFCIKVQCRNRAQSQIEQISQIQIKNKKKQIGETGSEEISEQCDKIEEQKQ